MNPSTNNMPMLPPSWHKPRPDIPSSLVPPRKPSTLKPFQRKLFIESPLSVSYKPTSKPLLSKKNPFQNPLPSSTLSCDDVGEIKTVGYCLSTKPDGSGIFVITYMPGVSFPEAVRVDMENGDGGMMLLEGYPPEVDWHYEANVFLKPDVFNPRGVEAIVEDGGLVWIWLPVN